MLNTDQLIEKITAPDVTEEQLQQYLQQVNTALTEVNVTLKITEENLSKSLSEDHPLKDDITQLIHNKDTAGNESLMHSILEKLSLEIDASVAELKELFNLDLTQVSDSEKESLTKILNVVQNSPTEEQLTVIMQDINNSLSANQSALAVQQSQLNQALASTSTEIADNIKLQIEAASQEDRVQVFTDIIATLEAQIQENIKAFKEYQQSQKGNGGM